MIAPDWDSFREIWVVDFKFGSQPGDPPVPICMVAKEIRTGMEIQMWQDEIFLSKVPPLSIGDDSLYVAYQASEELGCHIALNWTLPANVLDLSSEFRCITNIYVRKEDRVPIRKPLIDALAHFGLDWITVMEKEAYQSLVPRIGPWNRVERAAILEYCYSEATALESLFAAMTPQLRGPSLEIYEDPRYLQRALQRSLLRGRYMKAVAHMEIIGVPIDVPSLSTLKSNWSDMQDSLILKIDGGYQVYDGNVFKIDRWEHFVLSRGIPWPRLESGELSTSDETFKEMAKIYPEVRPMRELRYISYRRYINGISPLEEMGATGTRYRRSPVPQVETNRPKRTNSQVRAIFLVSLPGLGG